MILKRIFTSLMLTSAILFVFNNALANIGPYVDINGGIAFSDSQRIQSAVNQEDNGFGYNANIGWMFIPLLGLEAGVTKYPDVTYRFNSNNKSASLYGYDVAIKGVAPLPLDHLSLVGKLGIGRLNQGSVNFVGNDISSDGGNNLYWGIGFKYDLPLGFYTQLLYQVNQGSSNIPTSSLLSLGLGFQL